ncbi:NAD-dependent epimerase/dehydratase family protein [Sphingobacterium oryzagri]|uniref:NAD-dependent epimerase/dehydratase family protein n=1 Tax=Sphingobacterium oryzagri TaxID=3025669 RepID=A0ABY7WH87_9SPHI|nr:NAD-dependent epimerase/dehydratase family protein [Sphingobacterium sp. KACC 22765]WDF68973.1 NAD-dependent epimerase/dehydratase family protein [Sphingobacterium sp. KACC 22765]
MIINITGASGFVGKNLSAFLHNRGFTTNPVSLRMEGWSEALVNQSLAIVHLAGKAHDMADTTDEEEYFKINTDLTVALFNAFLASETRDFYYFSSVKACADVVSDVLFEDTIASPVTPYGKSKLEAERYIQSMVLPAEKRVFIIRPCMIHGPENKGNLNLLYNVVKTGVPWPLASFKNQRSFLGIDNLNFLIERVLLNPAVSSGIYNFADDDTLSTNDLVASISSILGKKPSLWHISPKIIYGLAKVGDRLSLPLNTERLKKLTESYVVSNKKIKDELQLDKLPVSAQEGIRRTIKSFPHI